MTPVPSNASHKESVNAIITEHEVTVEELIQGFFTMDPTRETDALLIGILFRVCINTAILRAFLKTATKNERQVREKAATATSGSQAILPTSSTVLARLVNQALLQSDICRDHRYNILATLVWFTRVSGEEGCETWDRLAMGMRLLLHPYLAAVSKGVSQGLLAQGSQESRQLVWALCTHVLVGQTTEVVPLDPYLPETYPRVLRLVSRHCAACGTRPKRRQPMELCPVCYTTCYCNIKCRSNHWLQHKSNACPRPHTYFYLTQRDLYDCRPPQLIDVSFIKFLHDYEIIPPAY